MAAITGALAAAGGSHDLVLTSGGVSVGDEDHVRAAVESLGQIHFWRLAIKPGPSGRIGPESAARPSSACRATRSLSW